MTNYLFGYGSMILMEQNKELDNPRHRKAIPVLVSRMKRSWNVYGKDSNYLGVLDIANFDCNGVFFKVSQSELAKFDKREKYYVRKTLSKNRFKFKYENEIKFKPDDVIYCYYPKTDYIEITKKNRIEARYIRKCLKGCEEFGDDFYADFIYTTHNT